MKKEVLFFIGFVLAVGVFGQTRTFQDFPEETSPNRTDIVLTHDGTRNEKVQIPNIFLDTIVKAASINQDVAGAGLSQDGNGALQVNAGTGLTISGDNLNVTGYGDLAGGSPYYFTSTDFADTLILYAAGSSTGMYGEEAIWFWIINDDGTFDAIVDIDVSNTRIGNYGVEYKLVVDSTGVTINDTAFFENTTNFIYSDGSELYFSDPLNGTNSLYDLLNASLSVSGVNTAVLYNDGGSVGTSTNFLFDASSGRIAIGGSHTISGNRSNVLGGISNTSSGLASTVINGNGSAASGNYSMANGPGVLASGNYSFVHGNSATAHDAYEVVFGLNPATATGSSTSVNVNNRIFCVANALTTAIGAESSAFEIYHGGNLHLGDSLNDTSFVGTIYFNEAQIDFKDTVTNIVQAEGTGNITSAVAQELSGMTENSMLIMRGDTIYYTDSTKWEDGILDITGNITISGNSTIGDSKTDTAFFTSNNHYITDNSQNSMYIRSGQHGSHIQIGGDEADGITIEGYNGSVFVNSGTSSDTYVRLYDNQDSVKMAQNVRIQNGLKVGGDATVNGKTILGDAQSDTTIVNGWLKNKPPHYKAGFADSAVTITGGDSIQVTNGDSLFRVADIEGFTYGGSDTIIVSFDGGYFINFNQRGYGTAGADWKTELAYKRGGVVSYDEYDELQFTTTGANNKNGGNIMYYVELEAGDKIWFITTRTAGSGNYTMTSGSIIIRGYLMP